MAVMLNDKWTMMSREDGSFALTMAPHERGELLVLGKKHGASNYTAVLGYSVAP